MGLGLGLDLDLDFAAVEGVDRFLLLLMPVALVEGSGDDEAVGVVDVDRGEASGAGVK